MRKKRRKKKFKRFIIFVLFVGLTYVFFYIDKNDNEYSNKETLEKLLKLGYSDKSIDKMLDYDLSNIIIESNKYSATLEYSLENKLFNKECLGSYLNLGKESVESIYHLCDLNYTDNEISQIINKIDKNKIKKLESYLKNLAMYSNYSNFILENYDRYEKYKEADIKKKISFVNVGIDYNFYENVKKSINQNNDLILVNKYYKLDSTFVNEMEEINTKYIKGTSIKLQKNAKEAFERLCEAALEEGFVIKGTSGYRSYNTQKAVYSSYLKIDSLANVDTYSARAGHSEHQTGYAIDVANDSKNYEDFRKTKEYYWAKDNIHNFGFIIRYTTDNQYITGYKNEPWHFRYVGIEAAKYIYENNITLEEYLLNNKEKI